MPNPCPSCNKLASLEMQDPEVYDLELDDDGKITGFVRIVRASVCCGDAMKEATFDIELDAPECPEKGTFSDVDAELSSLEEGGGRYAKSYFGAEGVFKVTCSCSQKFHEVKWSDKIAASAMDEMV